MFRPLILSIVSALVVFAQQAPQPEFGAASVKELPAEIGWPPRAGYWVSPRVVDPQRFRALTYVSQLIEWAYDVRDFQVPGGPAWIKETQVRFEIQATAEKPSSLEEMRRMLRTLLADRFKLTVHRESRDFPVYALTVGRNGPRLAAAKDSTKNGGNGNIDIGNGVFTGRGVTMTAMVPILTDNLERPVVDKTNLTGHYDFTLHYDRSSLPDWRLGPALFSLVQDLGLRLEPQKAPFETIVIDSVDRPSRN